jgi:hypothetical protein
MVPAVVNVHIGRKFRAPQAKKYHVIPNIMIRCPITGKAVPTGLSTETVLFDSLGDISVPMRCPACLKMHRWKKKDAWVEKGNGGPETQGP